MPIFISLFKWTDQGRAKVDSLPDRAAEVEKRLQDARIRVIGNYTTMGRYDQVSVVEAPDAQTAARFLFLIAGRGNAVSETLQAFTMDEVRQIMGGQG